MKSGLGWLVLATAAVVAAPALAAPPSALDPVTAAMWTSAEQAEARGQLERAAAGYSSVFQATQRPEAALALGNVWMRAERPRQAEAAFRLASGDRDAQVALLSLLVSQDRLPEARRLLGPMSSAYAGDPEVVWFDVLVTAPDDPEKAEELLNAWLGYGSSDALEPDDAMAAAMAIYDAYREADRVEDAARVLQRVMAAAPETVPQLQQIGDRAAMELLAVQLSQAHAQPLTGVQRERLQRASEALDAGDLVEAQNLLDALVVQARYSPEVLGLRAAVHTKAGRFAQADVDLRMAEALDPVDPRWPLALGAILADAYANRLDAEAVDAWNRGLGLDPGRADVWLQKGMVELRLASSDPDMRQTAQLSLHRAQTLDPAGPNGERAAQLLAAIARQRLERPSLGDGRGCPPVISDEACRAYHLALTYHRRGAAADEEADRPSDAEQALGYVKQARTLAPDWVRALNLQATILRARAEETGREADQLRSLELFRQSLELDPEQPEIWVYLGKVKDREGDRDGALQAWEQAIALPGSGGAAAHVYLAEESAKNWDYFGVRRHLDAYALAPSTAAVQESLDDRATALASRIQTVEQAVVAGGIGLAGAAVVVPAIWLWRRRRGATVEDLLARDPGSWRAVARIASALRHEVLKHHTSILGAVADGLEDGDVQPAEWLAEQLQGDDSPVHRGRRYLQELMELGRRVGVPLDLESRDPVFSPVWQGLERLHRIARPLSRGARRIVPEIRAICDLLHDQAYPALGRLVRRICVVQLDAERVQQCWDSVGREPSFQGQSLPALQVEGPHEALHVRVWRDELDLIMVNLLRNAVQASLDSDGRALRVTLDSEEDPITFLERAVVRVADQAPKTVSTAMIRGRYIERGLGLTVDVISRNGGSIHVEDEPGWSKAVVVRLPRVEVAEEMA
ncbi:MAG: hypothetical protein AB8H79_07775 [Myxococcota bacterium]